MVILTTSNITERIDVAFVDRADIRQYIGPPSAAAIFKIYLSCLEELMRVSGAVSCFSENTLAFSGVLICWHNVRCLAPVQKGVLLGLHPLSHTEHCSCWVCMLSSGRER